MNSIKGTNSAHGDSNFVLMLSGDSILWTKDIFSLHRLQFGIKVSIDATLLRHKVKVIETKFCYRI